MGTTVTELLTEYFTDIMDLEFTAKMEEELDDVSRGEREWVPMLDEFYSPFQKALEEAQESMPKTKVEEETDEVCENCGQSLSPPPQRSRPHVKALPTSIFSGPPARC